MIAVQTASPATMRYRTSSRHRTVTAAIRRAGEVYVEGSVIARVAIDSDLALRLEMAKLIYRNEGGEWIDAATGTILTVQP